MLPTTGYVSAKGADPPAEIANLILRSLNDRRLR